MLPLFSAKLLTVSLLEHIGKESIKYILLTLDDLETLFAPPKLTRKSLLYKKLLKQSAHKKLNGLFWSLAQLYYIWNYTNMIFLCTVQ